MKSKRFLKLNSVILAICIIFSSCILINNAQASTYYVTGYKDIDVDTSSFIVQRSNSIFSKDNALPSSYSLPKLGLDTSVKNQNPYGTCWTFATMASAEGSVLKKNSKASIDLSELQLAYFFYNKPDDPMHLTTGDTNIALNQSTGETLPLSSLFDLGGNMYITSIGIAGGLGFVNEDALPYSKASSISEGNLPNGSLAYESNSYIVSSAYWLDMTDKDSIKEVVMNEGAVGFSIYYSDTYYNSSNHSYYCYDSQNTNHAVTIVGWDDNYSKKNFGNLGALSFLTWPSGDGAWIVKNSWGSSWGDGGYFYVSYYDKAIGQMAVKINASEAEDYYIYQYDGTGSVGSLTNNTTKATGANIYTAQSDSYLDSVGYFCSAANTNTVVKIYTDLQEDNNPLSGTLSYTGSVSDTYAGYHTYSLDNYVSITKDSRFSIVIEQSVSTGTIQLVVDYNQNYGWIKFNNESKDGESYIAFGDENLRCISYTNDYGNTAYYTVRIKAYAIDIPEFEFAKKDKTKLVKYNGTNTSISIPDKTKTIDDGLFSGNTEITSIEISEGVESIGKDVCKDCTKLTYVSLPSSLKSIGEDSFKNVQVDTLVLPESLLVEDVKAVDAKCESDGSTQGYHCSLCSNLYIESESISQLNHDFNNYISNNDATFHLDGTKTSKCSRCDKTSTITDTGSLKIPSTLEISTKGYTKYYHIGEEFILGNTVLTASTSNNYSEDKEVDETLYSGFDSTTAGEKTLTFSYLGLDATDTVTVVGYTLGDVNGDNSINDLDAIDLLMNYYFPEDYPINQKADFNLDGEVSDTDAIYLLMHSFFPEDYPIYDWWTVE